MKLAFFDDFKLGIVEGDTIVDVSDVVKDIPRVGPQDLIRGLIEQFDTYRQKLAEAAAHGAGKPLSQVRLRPPIPKPDNIVCMAVNYMEGRTVPAPINAFFKPASAIIGDGDAMVLPDVAVSVFEGEAEFAAIIGKTATRVKAEDAMDYVFGYTNFIDGSARGVEPKAANNIYYQMKSGDTFAPLGPWIVTADEIVDPHALTVTLTNNGVVMQQFNSNDMAHKLPRCIEWITHIHTLQPGDIVATGTNHGGLNPFMNGDEIQITTTGLGTLHINIRDVHERTWARVTRTQHKESGGEGAHTPQIGGRYAKSTH